MPVRASQNWLRPEDPAVNSPSALLKAPKDSSGTDRSLAHGRLSPAIP
jgi:hypothetical protein